jgi:NAD(P)H-nitrite reductase large subunit
MMIKILLSTSRLQPPTQGVMHMKKTQILIIGAGTAGLAAAKAAVKLEKQVVLVCTEAYPPYLRPRLPEVISSSITINDIVMNKPEWFEAQKIKLILSETAVNIDTYAKIVTWDDGEAAIYEKLIIACGSLPNKPHIYGANEVLTLYTYDDAITIKQKSIGKPVFIIGGGVLSIETAYALLKTGCKVAIAEQNEYLLPRQLDKDGGIFIKQKLEQLGLEIFTNADFEALKDKISACCVIAAAGVKPCTELFKNTDIKLNRGILVDENMQTSVSDIYACGDVAEFADRTPGLVSIAIKQGETAGTNAADGKAVYTEPVLSPMIKTAGISLMSIGNITVDENTTVLRMQGSDNYSAVMLKQGKLQGAALIGSTSLGSKLKSAIEKGAIFANTASFNDVAERL